MRPFAQRQCLLPFIRHAAACNTINNHAAVSIFDTAQHDPEQCTPGGEDGNFIMFARATSGDKKNNNKFSQCSLKAIEPVLNAKARSAKGCFTGEWELKGRLVVVWVERYYLLLIMETPGEK